MTALLKSRPTTLSPVEAALAAPLPHGLAEAVAAAQAAAARYAEVRSMAGENHHDARLKLETEAKNARVEWQRAAVLAEIGGDDAPSEEHVAALKATADRAADKVEHFQIRVKTLTEETDRRRKEMEAANAALSQVLQPWKTPLIEAIDDEIAHAAHLINGHYKTVRLLDAWRNWQPPEIYAHRFSDNQTVHGGDPLPLPPAIAEAAAAWTRIFNSR